ncbi:MAG: adenosine deaminase [Lentisphaerae bacterium RIFOXYB12_FULL_65_16]|nr:MAG: adenosine deaminase [Lentisphaerae bacterium RIFOXYA12_64_32]OGV86915.1 MAG: adenosine deaminase [Lentisphaerae bacterium RIFOXYB12_FULL_65_16]
MAEARDETIARLPKIELHLHLEGGIRRSTLLDFAPQLGVTRESLESPEWAQRTFRFQDLGHFLKTMRLYTSTCVGTPKDYERTARELFEDLVAENCRYAEISFDPTRGIPLHMTFEEIFGAICRARDSVLAGKTMQVGLIVAFARSRGAEVAVEFARAAAAARNRGVVGIDLHGDELAGPAEDFAEAYAIARDAGLGLRAHAGEAGGADSVWSVIRGLGVSRVAHGVRAKEDPALMEYLETHAITLDMCPVSNLMLGVVPALAQHPIREFFDRGVRVTVGTDDPLFFDTTITGEYQILAREMHFTHDELRRITLMAVDGCFLQPAEKAVLRRDIEQGFDRVLAGGAS